MPSERVTTRLRIREAPEATAAIVGNLEPGQSLSLRASIPSRYELQLPDGSSGFVSKAWARLIPDGAAADGPELRVRSWNIRKLGHGTNKDFSALANVVPCVNVYSL